MNFIELSRKRAEREFKFIYQDKYPIVENAVNDALKTIFELLKRNGKISFKSAEKLEEDVNTLISEELGLGYRFRVCEKLKHNYSTFFKVLFEDFSIKTPRGSKSFLDGYLDKCHIALISPDYIDDDYERPSWDLSGYLDHKVNLFGNLSRTEGVTAEEISPDIQIGFKSLCDNISSNIYVSLVRMNIGILHPNTFKPEALGMIVVDINSDIVKKLSLNDLRTTVFREEVFNVILNKFFLSIYTNMVYFSIVGSYDKFKNVLLYRTETISYFDIYMSIITNILSSNSVNCQFDPLTNNPELSLSALLDSIRFDFLQKSSFSIINNGIDDLRRFLVHRNHQYPIFLDYLLSKYLDLFRNRASSVQRNKNGVTFRETNAYSIIPKNFSLESCEKDTMHSNFVLKDDKAPSIYSFYGAESLSREDSTYERMRRTKRMELLSKLTSSERNKLFRIENELAKLRADSINCESQSIQKIILKKLATIAKDINDLISNSKSSEDFKTIMFLTENERMDIEVSLSNRDFVKERKTMLYGQLATRNEYNY